VQLGQFARHDDVLRGAEDRLDVGQRVQNAVRSLVEDERAAARVAVAAQGFERCAPLALLRRQKSVKGKRLGVQAASRKAGSGKAAGNERADRGVRTRHGKDGDSGGDGGGGDLSAGVGDSGRSRVADHGDSRSRLERRCQLKGTARLIMHVIADSGGANLEVVEQLLRLARVLAGDAIDRAQHTQGAQGDVFQIADGRGN